MSRSTIFVSTGCLSEKQPLRSRLLKYIENGICSIELGAGVTADNQELTSISDFKCNFLIHNYFPPPPKPFIINLASPNADIRKQSVEFVCKNLELCTQMAIPFYSVHAGFITDPKSLGLHSFILPAPKSLAEKKSALERFNSSIELCLTYAQKLGISILVENNPCSIDLRDKLLLQTSDEIIDFIKTLSSSYLGILFDTGHFNVSAKTLNFDPNICYKDILPYIGAVHVHGNDGLADTHQPVQPNSWIIEFLKNPMIADLPIIVEAKFNNINELLRHIDWLKGII